MAPLTPARLQFAETGVPYSTDYADVYHSADGGPGQARHVFLAGNRLPARWQGRENFVILETGFGTGLNFLATWAAWRGDAKRCRRLHFLSVEKHPFRREDLAILHAGWPEFACQAAELRAAWPILVPGQHRLEFDQGGVVLTLLLGEAKTLLDRLQARVDAIYLDGFSPDRNPELWSPAMFARLARLARTDATLATWSVAGAVRDGLAKAGFATEKARGYGRKKAMLRGGISRHPGAPDAGGPTAVQPALDRRAIVIGAGLAGSTCCAKLAARGWDITLVDANPGPAMAASGNPVGILMPLLSRDDNIASRLSRAALLHTVRHWQTLAREGAAPQHQRCGVLQMGRDSADLERQADAVGRLGFPPEFVRFVGADEAAGLAGRAVPAGGWFFGQGGWANPADVCRANLAACGGRLHALYGQGVTRLERASSGWLAWTADNVPAAEAPVLILAAGAGGGRLLAEYGLPIQPVRGQLSLLPAGAIPALGCVLCRDGYVAPAVAGVHSLGATYDLENDPRPSRDADLANLRRLDHLLMETDLTVDPTRVGHRVGFRAVAPDRLPLVGQLPTPGSGWHDAWSEPPTPGGIQLRHVPRQPGVFGLLGYASRGLIWTTLMAEILAAQLDGEPAPVASDLLAAIDPARFALRRWRRNQA